MNYEQGHEVENVHAILHLFEIIVVVLPVRNVHHVTSIICNLQTILISKMCCSLGE